MKFLVDAQLPRQLARHLTTHGHDAVHTLDLPGGNRTSDRDLRLLADSEGRMVVTKDADFVDTHVLAGSPRRLLLISTGNIANPDLLTLIDAHLTGITSAFGSAAFIELTATQLVFHQD